MALPWLQEKSAMVKKNILSEKCYPLTTDTEINCFLSDRAILAVH